jgi:pimeloyl-ACP methyl ester carboxylesterase
MRTRSLTAFVALAAVGVTGVTAVRCPAPPVHSAYVTRPGFVQPQTPGSGLPDAITPTVKVQRILGAAPDLNRVTTLRFSIPKPSGAPPRAVLILVPGFLGGAGNFTPLAQQLVNRFSGNLEVWAVDRRPNQLEDRRGGLHGRARLEANDVPGYLEAIQFYFPDDDFTDIDRDGVIDPPFALPDALGGATPFQQLAQDDARFAAYWGLDTYVRDWKILVDEARAIVGPTGLVLFGGHSAGTGFAGIFAAYDLDPGPGVDAVHDHIDGLLLLEGGGPGTGSSSVTLTRNGANRPAIPRPTSTAAYDAVVAQLAAPGGFDVFLPNFTGIVVSLLGVGAELAGLDGSFRAEQESLMQRTSLFGSFPLDLILAAPMTAETVVGLFIDDDHSPVATLSGSYGFSDNGPNTLFTALPPNAFYIADPAPGGALRAWKDFDDPTLPRCPPHIPTDGTGCAIESRGDRPNPTDPPRRWGTTAEVSALQDLVRNQWGDTNFLEWYYLSGRVTLDLSYGRNSSSLGDESRLAVTQNAAMDKPVLCIGGSNGLAPSEASFASYLGSIATPTPDKEIFIAEGYAHLDPLTARNNAAVPPITDWVNRLLQRKLLETF